MRRRWVITVLVAACGRIGFAPIDDSVGTDALEPTDDQDGDGFTNDTDNCPTVSNASQVNEDADRFGDACDPCPPFGDGTPIVDQEGDGLPDACDPYPTQAGDHLFLFDGFNLVPTAAERSGNWTFTGGNATVTTALNAIAAVSYDVPVGARVAVAGVATIDRLYGNLVARPVGVAHHTRIAQSELLMCVFGVDPSNQEVFAIADNATTAALDNAATTNANVGDTTDFMFRRVGTSYTCSADRGATNLAATSSLISPDPDRVGLFVRSADAHFPWVMIVISD